MVDDDPTPALPAEPVELEYAEGGYEPTAKPVLGWPDRILLPLLAVVAPAVGLWINSEIGIGAPVPVDWQSGEPLAVFKLLTLPSVAWPLLPFLGLAMAAVLAVSWNPEGAMGRTWIAAGRVMDAAHAAAQQQPQQGQEELAATGGSQQCYSVTNSHPDHPPITSAA
jgi:hypothetical protein